MAAAQQQEISATVRYAEEARPVQLVGGAGPDAVEAAIKNAFPSLKTSRVIGVRVGDAVLPLSVFAEELQSFANDVLELVVDGEAGARARNTHARSQPDIRASVATIPLAIPATALSPDVQALLCASKLDESDPAQQPAVQLTMADVAAYHDLLRRACATDVASLALHGTRAATARASWAELCSMLQDHGFSQPSDLYRVFRVLAGANDDVDVLQFAIALSVYQPGNKSEKLSTAFAMFSERAGRFAHSDRVDFPRVSPRDLSSCMTAVLAPMLAMAHQTSALSDQQLAKAVRNIAGHAANRAFEGVRVHGDGTVAFEQFGEWYNAGGYFAIPWLELLSPSRWPQPPADWLPSSSSSSSSSSSAAGVSDRVPSHSAVPRAGDSPQRPSQTGTDGTLAAASAGDRLLLSLAVGGGRPAFTLHASQVAAVRRLLRLTQLDGVEPEQVQDAVLDAADNEGMVTLQALTVSVGEVADLAALRPEERGFVEHALSILFRAFDREGGGQADAAELATGVSVLCAGSKSDKLALAFQLFDDDGDGRVSEAELWQYLRAFLTALFGLTRAGTPAASDAASYALARSVLCGAGSITFEQFAHWYTSGGFEAMPWLELLDNRKWQVPGAPSSVPADATSSVASEEAAASRADDMDESIAFAFPLLGTDLHLVITTLDARLARSTADSLGLLRCPFGVLLAALTSHELEGALTESATAAALSSIASRPVRLGAPLQQLLALLDWTSRGQVSLQELATALSVLCAGSKSDKLALAFRLFDEDDDGFLSRRQLWRYLRSFLFAIIAFSSTAAAVSEANIRTVVNSSVVHAVRAAFELSGEPDASRLSFEQVGHWYNEAGFHRFPWIELLDLGKWQPAGGPVPAPQSTTASAALQDRPAARSQSAAAASMGADALGAAALGAVGPLDLRPAQLLVKLTQLDSVDAEQLQDAVLDAAGEDGMLSLSGFACSMEVANLEGLGGEEREFVERVLSNLFDAFVDAGGAGEELPEADAAEVATALSVLCAGCKSDKLALAFPLFDGDGDGRMNQVELWQCLRAFLFGLHTLAAGSDAVQQETLRAAEHAALAVTSKVFAHTGTSTVSFEDLADWYNTAGYATAQWLELLDVRKWPLQLAADAAPAQAGDGDGDSDHAPAFVFQLRGGRSELAVAPADVARLHRLLRCTRLSSVDPEQCFAAVMGAAAGGALHRRAFDNCLSSLVDMGECSQEDASLADKLLSSVFYAAADERRQRVDASAVAAGLSVLCAGSKSDKLSQSFPLFDGDDDGRLSRVELGMYLGAFVAALLALTSAGRALPHRDAARLAREAGDDLAREIMRERLPASSRSISFEEFAAWYSEGGYVAAPWLELLDNRKWNPA